MTKEELIATIEKMTVLELADLVKALEERFGVSAASVAVATAPVAAAAPAVAAAPEEEQTEFTVVLTGFGAEKIKVIKAVREITGLGLKEAKDLVEGVPKPVKEGASKQEAAAIEAKLKDAGATVEVR